MKNKLSYIIITAVVLIILLLVIAARLQPQKINERITLRQRDKLPYGTFVAQQLLHSIFPKASISNDMNQPGYWQTLSEFKSKQAIILFAKSFNASKQELDRLTDFARNGNYVFIVARTLSTETNKFFDCIDNSASFDGFYGINDDSLQITLEKPPFSLANTFIYPGKKFESYFSSFDSAKTIVLGRTQEQKANFIQLNVGKGSVFIHLAPLAFSNYFLLHKSNVHYFQNAIAVIPAGIKDIVWSEYYLSKPANRKENEPKFLRVLFQYPSFKWALITAVTTLLLYALIEMRRKQRWIPAYEKPTNESADFVKTIGRLYYEGGDHKNIAQKMSVYFIDYVRSKYKFLPQALDDAFIVALHHKSNYPVEKLKEMLFFINNIKEAIISDQQLFTFYKQLEQFYQTT